MSDPTQDLVIPPAPAMPVAPVATPQHLLQTAVEQGADIDKLEKLMALQERWEASEAKKAYTAALSAFKANPPTLEKNRHVKFQTSKGVTEYNHATLDSIADTLGKALSEHGLSFTWGTQQGDGGLITVTCTLTHVMGHSESTSLSAGSDQSGGKNNIQAVGSTVTYLQRYTLRAITGTAEGGTDNDGAGAPMPRISEEQANQIHAKITDNDLDMASFMKWLDANLKVNRISDIAEQAFEDVMRAIDARIKAKDKA